MYDQNQIWSDLGLFIWHMRLHAHTSAHMQIYLHVLFVIHVHVKSHIQPEKVLFHRIFYFQSFVYVYEHHLWIMRYRYNVNSILQVLIPVARSRRSVLSVFGFIFLFENFPSLYCTGLKNNASWLVTFLPHRSFWPATFVCLPIEF